MSMTYLATRAPALDQIGFDGFEGNGRVASPFMIILLTNAHGRMIPPVRQRRVTGLDFQGARPFDLEGSGF